MDQRSQAISILKQARDILADRLAETVCQRREEILEDAIGLAYNGQIEAVWEQVGSRLANVNSMLSNLPASEPLPEEPIPLGSSARGESGEPGPRPYVQADTTAGTAEETGVKTESAAGEAEPRPAGGLLEPVSMQAFLRQVTLGRMEAAGGSLATLFGLDPATGRRCAGLFRDRVARSPEVFVRALSLQAMLGEGAYHEVVAILADCFGLRGPEAISALRSLRSHLLGL